MKKYSSLLWFIGLMAFVALITSGTLWLLSKMQVTGGPLNIIKHVADICLIVSAVIAGWLWLYDAKWNKTVRIVFMVLFIIFAVLAVCGVLSI